MDDHWARLETRIGDIEADLQKVKTYVDAVVGTSLDGYTAVQHIKGLMKNLKTQNLINVHDVLLKTNQNRINFDKLFVQQ